MDEQPPQLQLVCFTFIVDDIVLPDGKTAMCQLGGGGPQSLWGFQLATSSLNLKHQQELQQQQGPGTLPGSNGAAATRSDGASEAGPAAAGEEKKLLAPVGLAAGIGPDVPESCLAQLRALRCDVQGLVLHERPTARAWQVFEADGRRTQVWRGLGDPCGELYEMLRPRVDNLPPHFLQAANFHLGIHPLHAPLRLLRTLRAAAHAAGGILSVEPYTAADRPASPQELQELLHNCDVFSPNLGEAESMLGLSSSLTSNSAVPSTAMMAHGDGGDDMDVLTPHALDLAGRLLDVAGPGGARVVVVRCAERGVVARLRVWQQQQQPQPHAPGQEEDESSGNGSWVDVACTVPAVADSLVVDVTGAGNSCCGGFMAAVQWHAGGVGGAASASEGAAAAAGHGRALRLEEQLQLTALRHALGFRGDLGTGDPTTAPSHLTTIAHQLAQACAWACTVASLMIEEVGVPSTPMQGLRPRALQRHAELLPRTRTWVLSDGAAGGGVGEVAGATAQRAARPPAASALRPPRAALASSGTLGTGNHWPGHTRLPAFPLLPSSPSVRYHCGWSGPAAARVDLGLAGRRLGVRRGALLPRGPHTGAAAAR